MLSLNGFSLVFLFCCVSLGVVPCVLSRCGRTALHREIYNCVFVDLKEVACFYT